MNRRTTRPRRRSARLAPTGTAWRLAGIGLGLLAAAINTGNNLLYLLLGLLLAAIPVCLAGAWLNFSPLRIEVRVPRSARAGSPFTLEVLVHHRRRRIDARGLELRVLTDRGSFGPAWIERVEAGSTTRLVLTGRKADRGVSPIVGVSAESTFPLGFLLRRKVWPMSAELLVLPAGASGDRAREESDPVPGQATLSRLLHGQEYEGLRRARAEDDVRGVDWKATARRGTMMYRETAAEARLRVDLNLVTRTTGDPLHARRAFERTVSRLADQGQRVLEADGSVRLTLDGRSMETFSGSTAVIPLLSRLAKVVPTDARGRALPAPPVRRAAASRSATEQDTTRQTPPGRAHRFSALAALTTAMTALFAAGGYPAPVYVALLGTLVLVTLFEDRLVARAGGIVNRLWQVAGVLALGGFLVDLFTRHNPLFASVNLVLFITFYEIFNATSVRDDRLVLLLSFMHLVLAAALTTEVSFGIPLLIWLTAAVHAQMARASLPAAGTKSFHPLRIDGKAARPRYLRPALANVAGLLVAGALAFFLIPHLGTGTFRAGETSRRSSGFSDSTRLGDLGRIKLDSAPVMEVALRGGLPDGVDLRWRGVALELFDGRTWSRRSTDVEWLSSDSEGRFFPGGRPVEPPSTSGDRGLLLQDVRLEPNDARVLFAAERPERIVSRDFELLRTDAAGALQARTRSKLVSYSVASRFATRDPSILRAASGQDPTHIEQSALDLPPLDSRIPQLARRLTAGTATRYDAARALEQWLSTNLEYTLNVQDRRWDDPLAAFLFDGMAGHCEYFATAMVVLARASDMPARLVTGYLRGETNRFSGSLIVRQSDAHAWVEVYFPGPGWIAFDPTPPAGRGARDEAGIGDFAIDLYTTVKRWWDDYLIGVDLQDQFQRWAAIREALAGFVGSPRRWLGATTLLALVGLPLLLLSRRLLRDGSAGRAGYPRSRRSRAAFYRRLEGLLARRGIRRKPGETPAELAARASGALSPLASKRVRELTDLYYRVRFDPCTSDKQVRRLASALLADLRQS